MNPGRDDLRFLRRSFEQARQARQEGNRPFGAVLVRDGEILAEHRNTQVLSGDCTEHAETNLLRAIAGRYSAEQLADATLYASGEPCAMCTAAIFWSGIGRVVYGLSSPRLRQLAGPQAPHLGLRCADVMIAGNRPIQVEGPLLEDEAAALFDGFFQ